MDFGGDAKIAKKVQDIIKDIHPVASIFIISADDEGEK